MTLTTRLFKRSLDKSYSMVYPAKQIITRCLVTFNRTFFSSALTSLLIFSSSTSFPRFSKLFNQSLWFSYILFFGLAAFGELARCLSTMVAPLLYGGGTYQLQKCLGLEVCHALLASPAMSVMPARASQLLWRLSDAHTA